MAYNWKHFFAIVALAILGGCATGRPSVEVILYPSPPDEPKLAYVRNLSGPADLMTPSFFDTLFGVPEGSYLTQPYGVGAVNEKVYVADSPAHVVYVYDVKEEKITTLGRGKLASPVGVAAADDGTVYVTDGAKRQVFVFDKAEKLQFSIGKKGEFQSLGGIAVNSTLGRLYVVDVNGHQIRAYTAKGEPLFQFGKEGLGEGEFRYPTNVAVDKKNGKVYVVDTHNFRVQVFDKDGKFLRKFGVLGDTPGTFSRPKGIGVDSEGHIYVVDAAFNNFQIFDDEGHILLGVGGAGNMPGYFFLPAGLYIDAKDRVYVVDSLNKRVQVFQYFSETWKKEHPEEYKKYYQPDTQVKADPAVKQEAGEGKK